MSTAMVVARAMRPTWQIATLGLVLVACADQSRPEARGGSDGGAVPHEGVDGSKQAAADAGAADGGTVQRPFRIYLGDDDRQAGAPALPFPTAAFFWGGDSNGVGWRIGNWFLTSDHVSDAYSIELAEPRDGGIWARGARNQGLSTGAVLWAQLDHPANRALDLAACSAVTFWARLDSPSGQLTVSLNDGTHPSSSLEDRSALPSRALFIGSDWQEVTVPFESFGLNELRVAAIEFFVGQGGERFDLLIDDLALLCQLRP